MAGAQRRLYSGLGLSEASEEAERMGIYSSCLDSNWNPHSQLSYVVGHLDGHHTIQYVCPS